MEQQVDTLHPTYPHLENLDRVLSVLDAPELWITEKIHGFNARFGRDRKGNVWVGSRNRVVDHATEPLQGFTAWALAHADEVEPGITLFGEWAGKGIQKGIDYGAPDFYLFAVMLDGELEHPGSVEAWQWRIGCKRAPFVASGRAWTLEELDGFRKAPSTIAPDHTREGIVLVPWPTMFTYGRPMIAKFKAPDFEERAHARREAPPPADLSTVQAFVEEYATDERLGHVIDQLREQGIEDPLDRVHTGALLRAYYADVVREGSDHFEALEPDAQKLVGKVLNGYVKALADDRRTVAADLLASGVFV